MLWPADNVRWHINHIWQKNTTRFRRRLRCAGEARVLSPEENKTQLEQQKLSSDHGTCSFDYSIINSRGEGGKPRGVEINVRSGVEKVERIGW